MDRFPQSPAASRPKSGRHTSLVRVPGHDRPFGFHANAGPTARRQTQRADRWQVAKDRAKEFLGSTPLQSDIWLAVFSDQPVNIVEPPFATEQDRQALLRRIDELPEPEKAGTWLYATLAKVLDFAQRLSEDRDGRYVSVLVFSDGKDETSPSPWTKAKLEEMFHEAVAETTRICGCFLHPSVRRGQHRETWWRAHTKDIQLHKHPLSIERPPAAVALKNAATTPEQSFELELTTTDDVWTRLKGQSVHFDFQADEGWKSPSQARLRPH